MLIKVSGSGFFHDIDFEIKSNVLKLREGK